MAGNSVYTRDYIEVGAPQARKICDLRSLRKIILLFGPRKNIFAEKFSKNYFFGDIFKKSTKMKNFDKNFKKIANKKRITKKFAFSACI